MDRRNVIADAAIAVVADSGLRALTHRGIDVALGLPAGSTSYYFRTKRDLLNAIVERITDASRTAFEDTFIRSGGFIRSGDGDDPADISVRYLQHLLAERPRQLRARHALLMDPGMDDKARERLGACLFSRNRAVDLFGDSAVADGFLALCEGLVVAGLERGTTDASMRVPIVTYLRGAGKA